MILKFLFCPDLRERYNKVNNLIIIFVWEHRKTLHKGPLKNYVSSLLDFANNHKNFASYLKVLSCLDKKFRGFKITLSRKCCFEEKAFKIEHTFFSLKLLMPQMSYAVVSQNHLIQRVRYFRKKQQNKLN